MSYNKLSRKGKSENFYNCFRSMLTKHLYKLGTDCKSNRFIKNCNQRFNSFFKKCQIKHIYHYATCNNQYCKAHKQGYKKLNNIAYFKHFIL